MLKIISEIKPERKIIDLNEDEYANLKYSSPYSIALDMCEHLIATNGICTLKMKREPNNIQTFFKIAKILKEEVSKYSLEGANENEKLTVLFDLPINRKNKVTEENYFLPHKKEDGYNVINFRLALKNTTRLDETDPYSFIENDNSNIVKISSDSKGNSKNCGQIASYILRAFVKDDTDTTLSFVSSKYNNSLEVKAYGALIIMERMRKEDLGMICGSFDKIPVKYRNKKIKIFGEIEEDKEVTKKATKINLHFALKNGVIFNGR